MWLGVVFAEEGLLGNQLILKGALCTHQYFITPSLYIPNDHKVKRGNGAILISVCLLGKEKSFGAKPTPYE